MAATAAAPRKNPLPGPPWSRGAAAVTAGSLPALTFPALSLWWLAPVALVPWLLLVRSAGTGRRAALDGWLAGTAFMLSVHHWLLPNLHVFLLLLAALLGALWAPWGWLVHACLGGAPGRARVTAGILLVPAGWLTVELARSWASLGGPWGLLGASQWQVPPALRLASLGGVWLISFLLVLVNTSFAVLIALPLARVRACATLTAAAVTASGVWLWTPLPGRAGTTRVTVVQPGVVHGAGERFVRGEELTRSPAVQEPDLVVWGESSVGFDLGVREDLVRRLAALSRETGADLLVNVDARRTDGHGISKSSVLVGPTGPEDGSYDKMRLVPFGEYIPARPLLGWVTSVGRAAGEDRLQGGRQVLMRSDGLVLGPIICFESAFPDMSRNLTDDGARLLVAQSSTSSFQDSWAPDQHASLAALRAAETWRPTVHATLTGVSSVFDGRGAAVGVPLDTGSSAARTYTVPLSDGRSPYVRFGDWVPRLSLLMLLTAGSASAVRRCLRPPR